MLKSIGSNAQSVERNDQSKRWLMGKGKYIIMYEPLQIIITSVGTLKKANEFLKNNPSKDLNIYRLTFIKWSAHAKT